MKHIPSNNVILEAIMTTTSCFYVCLAWAVPERSQNSFLSWMNHSTTLKNFGILWTRNVAQRQAKVGGHGMRHRAKRKVTQWEYGARCLCWAHAPSGSATRQRVLPTDRHSFVACQKFVTIRAMSDYELRNRVYIANAQLRLHENRGFSRILGA